MTNPASIAARTRHRPIPAADALYVDTAAAASRYSLTKGWFEKARVNGGGPPFIKVGGCVLYNVVATDNWFMACTRSSTSEGK